MSATVEHRSGRVNRLATTIEWLTDNGSCYTARETRRFAREINLRPLTTPPQTFTLARVNVELHPKPPSRFRYCAAAKIMTADN